MDYKEQMRLMIERNVHNVCPYEDKNLQTAYHIGFLQAVLVEMFLNDNKNLAVFKKIVEANNGNKK